MKGKKLAMSWPRAIFEIRGLNIMIKTYFFPMNINPAKGLPLCKWTIQNKQVLKDKMFEDWGDLA